MKLHIYRSAEEIGRAVAALLVDEIHAKPDCVLGLATGASPLPAYRALIDAYRAGEVSFSRVKTYNLDEYCGLPRDDKNSYHTFMHENLFAHVDLAPQNAHLLDGNAVDEEAECRAYDEAIARDGGIDVQLLGIGTNAHIGFNEPAEHFTDGAFKVKLTPSTIGSNSKYFDDGPMPEYALTMGIGDIMKARKILLIATGSKKAAAIRDTVEGEVTPRVPASILQTHPDAELFLDEEAASLLTR